MNNNRQNEILKIVSDNYNNIAESFDCSRNKKSLWPGLLNVVDNISFKKDSRILDVGCGNGRLLEILKEKDIYYLGVDNSSKLIDLAKKNYPNYNFQMADILNLEKISENNFDYILSIAVIHHLPGKFLRVKALREMSKKMSPDGVMIISVWRLWNQWKYLKLIIANYSKYLFTSRHIDFGDILFYWKNNQKEDKNLRYYHAFTLRELKKISKKANLKIINIGKDKFNYYLTLKIKP